jgi:Holliday junction resolvase-like predicted endonuclease
MAKNFLVRKQSGEQEPFSEKKLRQSMERSGAPEETIEHVIEEVSKLLFDGITTREIYQKAFSLLRKKKRAAAGRFSLKKAIMELGPTGYPFEQFVGEILKRQGYEVQTGQVIQGRCITHEVDVVASKDHHQYMIECKFYNHQGKVCNVRVPLYIDSRFRDIEAVWEKQESNNGRRFQGWVVTNTRFTTDAIDYGQCAGLHLVSWDYPRQRSLKEMIEQSGLFPITAITNLTKKQKEQLLEQNIVLCRQLIDNPQALEEMGISRRKTENIIKEAKGIINNT